MKLEVIVVQKPTKPNGLWEIRLFSSPTFLIKYFTIEK